MALVAVNAIAGGAARPSDPGAPYAAAIVIDGVRFSPNRLDARVGVALTVTITNRSQERHDLNFASIHMPSLAGVQTIVAPGETKTFELLFDRSGTHTFTCSDRRHAAVGMTGAAHVSP